MQSRSCWTCVTATRLTTCRMMIRSTWTSRMTAVDASLQRIMPTPHLTVWYNTRCPVCDAGIDWQRNKLLAAVRAGTIEFKDINEQSDALVVYGASGDDVRRRLHATDEAGRLIVGADVAIA